MRPGHSLSTSLLALCGLSAVACAAEAPAPDAHPRVPPAVRAAMRGLDKDARPVELRRSRSGVLYALLPNGAQLLVKEKRNAPIVSIHAFVRTGSIYEGEWRGAGLSHFCEHLLFKGTSKRPTGTLDREIRALGGEQNAWTLKDMTDFYVTCPAAGFAAAFDAVADMLMHATFPPEEVVKEHSVVVKEIEGDLDDPDVQAWRALGRLRYQVSPLRDPILGYPDRFRRVTRAEVWAYYQRRYAPQLTTFIAVGDVAAAKALPLMARTVAKWPRTSAALPAVPIEPPQLAPRHATITHPLCRVPKLVIAFPSVSARHADRVPIDVLANILGHGDACRLYREIVDKRQLATHIGATADEVEGYTGCFVVWATLEPAKVAQARAAIRQVLDAARRQPPTDAELARARRKVVAARVFGQMTAEQVAEALGEDWLGTGDLDYGPHYVASVQKVAAADVLRVARQYLVPHKLNEVLLLPETKAGPAATQPEAAAVASLKALEARRAALEAQPDVAAAKLLRGDRAAGVPTFEVRLKSGLQLVVREDTSLPAVHMRIACRGGQRWEPADLEGAVYLLGEMLQRGTRSRTLVEVVAQAESLGASLGAFTGRNSYGLDVRCLKDDLATLFELSADCLLHPAFRRKAFDGARQQVRAAIAERDESLYQLTRKHIRPLLYPGHPYGREPLGSLESLAKITPAHLRQLHSLWLRPEHLALAIVGDTTVEKALALVRKHLRFPRAKAPFTPPPTALAALAGKQEVTKALKDIKGATLGLAFRAPAFDHPDCEAVELIDALLSGLGGRLWVEIREKRGLAYDVGTLYRAGAEVGEFVVYIQTDAAKLQACIETTWREIKRLRDQLLTARELREVKNYVVGQEAVVLENQRALATRLAFCQLHGAGVERAFSRRQRLRGVTAQQLQQAARKYLISAAFAKVIIRPVP